MIRTEPKACQIDVQRDMVMHVQVFFKVVTFLQDTHIFYFFIENMSLWKISVTEGK